jgi:hypothetical protein
MPNRRLRGDTLAQYLVDRTNHNLKQLSLVQRVFRKEGLIMAKEATKQALAAQAEPVETPNHEQIASLAYQLWEQRGYPEGSPDEDWFRAEQELTASR